MKSIVENPNYGAEIKIKPKDAYAQLVKGAVDKQGTADVVSGATASINDSLFYL